jgi:hypothetical protein
VWYEGVSLPSYRVKGRVIGKLYPRINKVLVALGIGIISGKGKFQNTMRGQSVFTISQNMRLHFVHPPPLEALLCFINS